MRTTELTDKQARFIQLRADGWSYSDIAAMLGISKGSCSNWAKRYAAEINKAAAKLREPKPGPLPKPLPKVLKKKIPRVVDITDKLSFDSNPDELSLDHYLTPEFKERHKKRGVTPKELEGLEQLENAAKEIGIEARKAIEQSTAHWQLKAMIHDHIANEVAVLGELLNEIFGQSPITKQLLKISFAYLVEDSKQLLEEAEQYLKDYVESLPPEEREKLQTEIEEKQAAATRPEDITVLDTCDEKAKDIIASNTTAKIQNYFDNFNMYAAALYGAVTGNLFKINTTVKKPNIDKITGNATIKLDNGFVLSIENYDRTEREWRVSTAKLVRFCTVLLAENNHYREKNIEAIQTDVMFKLTDYMELLGTPITAANKKWVRAKVRADIDTLDNSRFKWEENRRGKNRAYLNIPILGGPSGIDKHGNVLICFSKEFARYLVQDAYVTKQYSLLLLKTDERNPLIMPLGDKILTYSGNYNNIRRGTANILSVKTLLATCKMQIPSYKTVMNEDRHWERRIREPLEKALDSMPFMHWHYCNPKGAPLTEEQLADNSYSSFIGSYVHFDLIDAPDQTKQVQAYVEKKARKRKRKSDTKRASDKDEK